ncbi:IS701 family transposase [Leptolyngbya ohadii]|uniref:IS701 family transposase n=1 Tax=Leptolyngbya ohadii TaxID=1962290 RepID=UPI000B59ECDE|nr:IS701 family transposase [Leptolyngbya ohadii]
MPPSRDARPTLTFVDEYCQLFQSLFPEVRSFEAFKLLHLGLISDIKRKSLPAIAKAVGLDDPQSLHHFLTESPWSAQKFRRERLQVTLDLLKGAAMMLLIDETGDRKKGKTTDYGKPQYIGNVGKKENGIVVVTAYGLYKGMILPLSFEVYKPHERLKPPEAYRTKPQIAAQMIRELQAIGFRFELVLGDSLYGESDGNFVSVLHQLGLPYILVIRSSHAMWVPKDQHVRMNRWRKFERTFTNGETETRYIRELIDGQRREVRYWQLTSDPQTLPGNSTWYVMSHVSMLKFNQVGDQYGFRTWVEYGLKQSKDELGWADFRMTSYEQIEKWWEMVMSAFLMVRLFAEQFNDCCPLSHQVLARHPWWDNQKGWKNLLNNLRLIIQPLICYNWLKRWLEVFIIPHLSIGFARLIEQMNQFVCPAVRWLNLDRLLFSSA